MKIDITSALLFLEKRGYVLHIHQERGGRWSAMALGEDRKLQPSGLSMYSRGYVTGYNTPQVAVNELIKSIENSEKTTEKAQESFDDLV